CYNWRTTATPLWRKDDEARPTAMRTCGLYYKLHGSVRPISTKSDIIRKHSRHGARCGGASASVSETPTASPSISRCASPTPCGPSSSASAGRASHTLAPESTTTHTYKPSAEPQRVALAAPELYSPPDVGVLSPSTPSRMSTSSAQNYYGYSPCTPPLPALLVLLPSLTRLAPVTHTIPK
ncbi:hypothetical protein DFH09DRAFT_900237, partial [Mycena vulgaris]